MCVCVCVQDKFAEYSRVQRSLIKTETKLHEVERPYKSKLFLYTNIARLLSIIVIVSLINRIGS